MRWNEVNVVRSLWDTEEAIGYNAWMPKGLTKQSVTIGSSTSDKEEDRHGSNECRSTRREEGHGCNECHTGRRIRESAPDHQQEEHRESAPVCEEEDVDWIDELTKKKTP